MAVYAISLCFMNPDIIRRSIAAFWSTKNLNLEVKHVLVDQHYPLDYEDNRAKLEQIALDYNLELLDPGRNLGLHDGFNWAMQQLKPADSDIIIGYDPDSLPVGDGWDLALVRAIDGDREQKIVWSSLLNPRSKRDIEERGYERKVVDGYLKLWVTRTAVTNSVCAWRYGWLRKIGGLSEPRAFYGHLEAAMWNKLNGSQWAFLQDWSESDELRDYHDRTYVTYKWVHSHLRTWDGDFASWLAAGRPVPPAEAAPAQLP